MAIGSGMSAQLGWALEDVVGLPAAPASFAPFLAESLTQDIERIDSDPVEARRTLRSVDWSPGQCAVDGDLALEMYARGLGSLLLLMLGSASTTQVTVDRWVHSFTPGNLTGTSATIQVGKPTTAAVVVPFTYAGCKVASWEMAATAGEYATLGLTVSALTETTDVPLAGAEYPAGQRPLHANRASLSLGGVPLGGVRSLRLAGDNSLDVERRPVTNSTAPDEALEDGRRVFSGTIEGEFRDTDAYAMFLDGSEAALTFALTDQTGESVAVAANVRIDGSTPHVAGRDVLPRTIPFTCVAPAGDDSALTVTVTNNSPTP